MTTEITTTAGVTAVVILLTTILLVVATKVFSRSPSRDSNNGGVAPNIPDASSSSSSSSSPSYSTTCVSRKYDVFLSFRGEDTRKTFVDHLYSALQRHAIQTYKDDETLPRGDTIGPSLLRAIGESQIALIIFSENYADSSWCLDELLNIMKCKEDHGQIVIPIFYNVDPSDVRKQKGKFGKAFAKLHKLSKNKKKVEYWKKALVDASNIAGMETKHVANGNETKCIQEIVDSILGNLSSLYTAAEDEELVGMRNRLEKLKFQLRIGLGGVRMVGIWGLGGGGKTTLATSLYKECSPNFDGCCFIENIREASKQHDGLKSLQEKILSTVFGKPMEVQSVELGKDKIEQMLCRRKVLIVLDDVDHPDQLKAFAGWRKWFGDGSRIIITTRDQHLLLTHRVDEVSPISLLSREEAARLLRRHAYHEDNPVQDYEELSQQIVTYAAGLPLALIVLGSFLYDKDKDEWLSTLDRLKYIPETDILEKLKISYDGLKDEEKEIFLDIACFFRNQRKGAAMEMLDACGFHSTIGVKVLIQKALISFTTRMEIIDMHDLVQEMAHYIVRGEHPKNPKKHSRIWRKEDIEDICFGNATMENDKIEAIQCFDDVSSSNFITFLSNMKKLRFLHVKITSFDEGPRFLSNELRYLVWSDYPASLFPESFQQTKLVYLRMVFSLQKELWKGYKYLPYLKKLELDAARELVRTPDIGGLPCLQKLLLDTCDSLEEIHQSLGNHSSLIHVSVKSCKKLTRFPTIVKMDKLEMLEISHCEALIEFPKIEANMDNLVTLSLEWVGIEIIPSTIGEYCTNLTLLELICCSKLQRIDGNFHALKGLKNFQLIGCEQFEMLPKDLFNENLDELFLDSSSIKLIRSSMARFLRKLDLCEGELKDGDIPDEMGELSNLQELNLSGNDFTRLGFSLSRLTHLKLLLLDYCNNLVELSELPSSLAILKADWCESLEVIKDDAHTRCKWLCGVSMSGETGNIITGGERLLESMLQGEVVKSGSMLLLLNGSEIPRGFEPRMVRGERCRMQLPEDWYNHFFGFLFCVVFDVESFFHRLGKKIVTRMKHDKSVVDDRTEKNDDDRSVAVDWLEGSKSIGTWVGYISFGSLRNTLWWDQTSTAIEFEFDSCSTIIGCGCKIIPKRSETTIITDSSSSFDEVSNDYNCKLEILHDSGSTCVVYIDNAVNREYLSYD